MVNTVSIPLITYGSLVNIRLLQRCSEIIGVIGENEGNAKHASDAECMRFATLRMRIESFTLRHCLTKTVCKLKRFSDKQSQAK